MENSDGTYLFCITFETPEARRAEEPMSVSGRFLVAFIIQAQGRRGIDAHLLFCVDLRPVALLKIIVES